MFKTIGEREGRGRGIGVGAGGGEGLEVIIRSSGNFTGLFFRAFASTYAVFVDDQFVGFKLMIFGPYPVWLYFFFAG